MNKRCSGCGVLLQYDKPELEGYVEHNICEKSKICRRCFRLRFYGDYIFVNKSHEEYENILNQISRTGDLVVYMVDMFDISDELINVDNLLDNPLILVLTKRDLLPKSVKENKIFKHIKTYNLDIIDMISISSEKNYNLDKLYKMIMKHKKSNNVYIVGNTNAGKSSFINKMIKNYSNNKVFITTSMLPTTTLDLMEIKINDKLTIVDTPGLVEEGNIVNSYDYMLLKKILPKKEVKPRTYQIMSNSSLLIEDLVRVDYIKGERNSFTLYLSNELEVNSVKINPIIKVRNFKRHSFEVNSGEDIVISGLGWIKIVNKAVVEVFVNENVKVYKRESII
ncbi:MAG: 50S ribosome-binding GTPase [Bacilli bacterium]|nr:50S ribosome-binding GTPase [Bacilli bacterium]MDD3304870.1 50S ribosome-binding GTPase [Bacilli bacterium]MDD4053715.1 50S ribosome-binding GTPase [Bacilli bacterium]MDD4411586.1 50S ribosome-binding GTPase [Bacilli bacterium]